MNWLKLNRGKRTILNLILTGIFVFLMLWRQGFPVQSYEKLLQRAAQSYLIESPVELLHADAESWTVYGASDGKLLRVTHGKNLFGMQWNDVRLFSEEVPYLLEFNYAEMSENKEEFTLCVGGLLTGFFEEAATAELTVTLNFHDRLTGVKESEETVTLTGVRESTACFRFPERRDGRDALGLLVGPAVLRLYDEAGGLLEEHTYERLFPGTNFHQ
ncbi:MAG: hypothetical protein E7429_04460 [Ruminococcaceae bacterium]|nr:hypothetical protein [Oscillospiraceae bacterium]